MVLMLMSSSKPEIIFVNDAILYPNDKNFGGRVDIMLLSSTSSPFTIPLLLLLLSMSPSLFAKR